VLLQLAFLPQHLVMGEVGNRSKLVVLFPQDLLPLARESWCVSQLAFAGGRRVSCFTALPLSLPSALQRLVRHAKQICECGCRPAIIEHQQHKRQQDSSLGRPWHLESTPTG
jgi:hypothetical protein